MSIRLDDSLEVSWLRQVAEHAKAGASENKKSLKQLSLFVEFCTNDVIVEIAQLITDCDFSSPTLKNIQSAAESALKRLQSFLPSPAHPGDRCRTPYSFVSN